MPLPRIWSDLSKEAKEDWVGSEATKAFLIEVARLAQKATASAETVVSNNPGFQNVAHHVSRATAFREVARLIQTAIEESKEPDEEDDGEEEE